MMNAVRREGTRQGRQTEFHLSVRTTEPQLRGQSFGTRSERESGAEVPAGSFKSLASARSRRGIRFSLVDPASSMVSCQKCRQPISPASFPNYDPNQSRPPHLDDSIASLSPSTYDFLSHSERYQHPHPHRSAVPPPVRPYYNVAIDHHRSTMPAPSPASQRTAAIQRVVVPGPSNTPTARLPPHLGPAESFVVLTDSVFRPQPGSAPVPPSTFASSSQPNPVAATSNSDGDSSHPTSLNSRLTQLNHLSSLLSSTSSIDHPLCTECADTLVMLMQSELEEGKKERDRLIAFEKEAIKKREDAKRDGTELTREGLEKDIAKVREPANQALFEC